MGQHNRVRKRLDLMREESLLRLDAERPWRCIGCFKTFDAFPEKKLQHLLKTGAPINSVLHATILQDNGVPLNVCATCLVRAAAKDDHTSAPSTRGSSRPDGLPQNTSGHSSPYATNTRTSRRALSTALLRCTR